MHQRTRKLIGAAVMVGFVVVYALVAMAVAQARAVQAATGLLQALIYMVIGLGWVLPMLPLIRWMEREDR
jgi:hypothetical protein